MKSKFVSEFELTLNKFDHLFQIKIFLYLIENKKEVYIFLKFMVEI
jgi:hypothetical protein